MVLYCVDLGLNSGHQAWSQYLYWLRNLTSSSKATNSSKDSRYPNLVVYTQYHITNLKQKQLIWPVCLVSSWIWNSSLLESFTFWHRVSQNNTAFSLPESGSQPSVQTVSVFNEVFLSSLEGKTQGLCMLIATRV